MRRCISVMCVEFDEGGHTLWVQGRHGTVLRLKTDGKITSEACTTSPGSHADVTTTGNIKICLGTEDSE